jgi:hypothetical protein
MLFFLSILGPFGHPQMDPKRYLKVCKLAENMSQYLNLKKSPKQITRPFLLEEIVQNNQKTGFYAGFSLHFGAIWAPPWTQRGTQRSATEWDV